METTEGERDIGVMISAYMKPAAQCAKAAKTAQAVLDQLARAFHYRDRQVFVRLYKQYVRPHLEFSTQAWSPWTEGGQSLPREGATESCETGVRTKKCEIQ
jgi:hypothetical protein